MSEWKVTDHLEVDLEGVDRVEVRLVAGDVAVTTGEGPVRLEVDHRSGPPVEVRQRGGALEIHHQRRDDSIVKKVLGAITSDSRRYESSVSLRVPPKTHMDVATVSAAVVCSGIDAETRVKAVSGDVTLDGIGDRLDVKTVSGEVAARGIVADLTAKTISGALSLVNGSSRHVDVKTVSGSVTLDLDPDPAGTYAIAAVSGSVSVRTPADPNLVVEASSVSGSVSGNGLHWEDTRPGRRRLRARLGEGGARLFVKTVSGSFRFVERARA